MEPGTNDSASAWNYKRKTSPGHRFSNEHYVSGCFTGRKSIRQSRACDRLAETLSERAARAISPVSVSPCGLVCSGDWATRVQSPCSYKYVPLTRPSPLTPETLFIVCKSRYSPRKTRLSQLIFRNVFNRPRTAGSNDISCSGVYVVSFVKSIQARVFAGMFECKGVK